MEGQERQVGPAPRLSGRLGEDARLDPVRALERVPGQAVLGVLMVQGDAQLLGRLLVGRPFPDERDDRRDVLRVARRRQGLLRLRQREVVDQAEAIPLLERPDLVFAVGVEGGVVDVERVAGRPAEVDRPLLPLVADDQLAPLERRGQHDDERRDHPVELLAVAMGQEEAPLLVEQQVVEVALELLALQPELFLDLADDLLDDPVPVGVLEAEAVRLHPPDAADLRVDEGLLALAVGGLMTVLDQLFRRPRGERQPDRPQALDLQAGQDGGHAAGGAERTGSIDPIQLPTEFVQVGGWHGIPLAESRGGFGRLQHSRALRPRPWGPRVFPPPLKGGRPWDVRGRSRTCHWPRDPLPLRARALLDGIAGRRGGLYNGVG